MENFICLVYSILCIGIKAGDKFVDNLSLKMWIKKNIFYAQSYPQLARGYFFFDCWPFFLKKPYNMIVNYFFDLALSFCLLILLREGFPVDNDVAVSF